MNIQEYLKINTSKIENSEKKKKEIIYEYDILHKNATEFIVERKRNGKADSKLVFITSENLLYKRVGNKDTYIKSRIVLDNFFSKSSKSFMQDLISEMNSFFGDDTYYFMDTLIESTQLGELKRKVLSHNVNPNFLSNDLISYVHKNYDNIEDWITEHKKLFPKIREYAQELKQSKLNANKMEKSSVRNIMEIVLSLGSDVNYNDKEFVFDLITNSNVRIQNYGIRILTEEGNEIKNINKEHNINIRNIFEYFFIELYKQGRSYLDYGTFNAYKDCLEMQKSLYGKIKNKYPKYFATYHDQLSLYYSIYINLDEDNNLKAIKWMYKDLEYENDKYRIVIPDSTGDLITEGTKNNNCVASYINKVLNRSSKIVFLRLKEEPEEPLITIEIVKKEITQAEGKFRSPVKDEEKEFIKNWAKEKELKLAQHLQ